MDRWKDRRVAGRIEGSVNCQMKDRRVNGRMKDGKKYEGWMEVEDT